MMYLLYQLIITIGVMIASPYLALKALLGGHGLAERLGFWRFQRDNRCVLWFHAASMGELKVISSILQELEIDESKFRLVSTTVTKTGNKLAHNLFTGHDIYYLPLDQYFIICRIVRKIRPAMLVLAETEIWPGMISAVHRSGGRICIVNGRLSEKSFKFYSMLKSLTAKTLGKIDLIMTQTDSDSKRFTDLGARPESIITYGNTKFDQLLKKTPNNISSDLKQVLTDWNGNFVFIAGSVHKGEFEPVIRAIKNALEQIDCFRAVIAPRHMKNVHALAEFLEKADVKFIYRSKLSQAGSENHKVILLDTMGELSGLYRYADLSFVGGSFVDIGGHDPLEPASAQSFVCFGPNMSNCRLFADTLVESGGAVYIDDSDQLYRLILNEAKGENGRDMEKIFEGLKKHTGVSKNIALKLTGIIDELAD